MSSIRPLHDRVIVKRVKEEEKTKGARPRSGDIVFSIPQVEVKVVIYWITSELKRKLRLFD